MTAACGGTAVSTASSTFARVGRRRPRVWSAGTDPASWRTGVGWSSGPSAVTMPFSMTSAVGSSVVAMSLPATSRASSIASGRSGKGRWERPITVSRSCVTRPMTSCWGSSRTPGRPRQVHTSSSGMRNGWFMEVSGLTMLPSPEF